MKIKTLSLLILINLLVTLPPLGQPWPALCPYTTTTIRYSQQSRQPRLHTSLVSHSISGSRESYLYRRVIRWQARSGLVIELGDLYFLDNPLSAECSHLLCVNLHPYQAVLLTTRHLHFDVDVKPNRLGLHRCLNRLMDSDIYRQSNFTAEHHHGG
ncbi:uncharacterized protein [Diadema setosum]|uniref:uncharacterized protein n=1 Tax=Diadema setosum TaxID=31175 RepID=UPI003B3BB0FD